MDVELRPQCNGGRGWPALSARFPDGTFGGAILVQKDNLQSKICLMRNVSMICLS